MKAQRLLIIVLLIFSLTISVSSQKSDDDDEGVPDDPNHPQMVAAIREYQRADRELNTVYKELLGVYENMQEEKGKLVKAQQAWIRYRDLAVSSEIAIYEVGSYDHKLCWNISNVEITKERISRMKKMISDAENIPELKARAHGALVTIKKWENEQEAKRKKKKTENENE